MDVSSNTFISGLYHELCRVFDKTTLEDTNDFLNNHDELLNSFLKLSVDKNHKHVTEVLVQHTGCDVNVRDRMGESVIRRAVRRGNNDVVRLLIDGGADIHHDVSGALYDSSNVREYLEGRGPCTNMTLIMEAAQNNQVDVIETLVAEGCSVNEPDRYTGKTALHLAAANGSVPCARVLLGAGAELDAQDTRGNTPLMMSVFGGYLEMTSMLVSLGSSVNTRCCLTRPPIIWAIDHENIPMIKLLLDSGADPNIVDNFDNRSPLHFAVEQRLERCAEHLVKQGALVNALDISQRSPTLLATRLNSPTIVRFLLESDGDPSQSDNLGSSPLVDAIYQGYFDIARLLIQFNCRLDVSIPGTSLSLYSVCLQTGHHEALQLLHQAGLPGTPHIRFLCSVPSARPKDLYALSSNLRVVDWLRAALFNPRALADMCRVVIRRAVGHRPNFRRKVMSLPTAGKLKEFLMFESGHSLTVTEL